MLLLFEAGKFFFNLSIHGIVVVRVLILIDQKFRCVYWVANLIVVINQLIISVSIVLDCYFRQKSILQGLCNDILHAIIACSSGLGCGASGLVVSRTSALSIHHLC